MTAGVANPFDLTAMKGPSQFDRRHVVGLTWMWEQSRQFENVVVNALAWMDGQRRAQLVERQSAQLYDGHRRGPRWDRRAGWLAQLADGKTVDDITREHANREDFIAAFFDTTAFAPVASLPRGIYGNVPKSAISGPAFSRPISPCRGCSVPGRQGMRLQFRGELFNAFNQVNFAAPKYQRQRNHVRPHYRHARRRPGTNRAGRAETALVNAGLGTRE